MPRVRVVKASITKRNTKKTRKAITVTKKKKK
jgi:hypothetical protein